MADTAKAFPAAAGRPLVGYLPEVRRDRLELLLRLQREHGNVVRFRMGPRWIHIVADPAVAQAILVDRRERYGKGIGQDFARSFLGDGLLTSEGASWARQRSVVSPLFAASARTTRLAAARDAADAAVSRWRGLRSSSLAMLDEMLRLTLGISWRLMFGEEIGERDAHIRETLAVAFDDVGRRIVSPFAPPLWVPTPANVRVRRRLRRFDELIEDALARSARTPGTMLASLRTQFSGEELRDQVVTLLFSGHETTAVALAWTLLEASASDSLWGRLEADRDDGEASLQALVRESLRLHPPVWGIPRTAKSADDLGDLAIPAGSIVLVSPFLMHRDPRAWDAPEEFRPQRFDGGVPASARLHYMPFGFGPRHCVGRGLAEASLSTIVSRIARTCRLRPIPGAGPAEPLLTLRPPSGLRMSVSFPGDSARAAA